MIRYFNFLLILLSIFGHTTELSGQQKLLDFIEDLRTTDEFTKSKIPLQAIKKGLSLGIRQYDIEKGVKNLGEYVSKANYYMTEITDMEEEKIAGILTGHKKKMIKHDHFSEWISVENENETTSMMILEKDEQISKVLVLIQLGAQVQLFEFNTTISLDDFRKIFSKKEMKRI